MDKCRINRYCKEIVTIIALCVSISLQAADFKVGGISYNIKSVQERTCIVTTPEDYNGRPYPNLYSGNIVIPKNPEYKGKTLTVVGIDDCAFFMCENLLSVSIPSTVEFIGKEAFYGCKKLSRVQGTINAIIGSEAFSECESLTSISLDQCKYISDFAFYGCSCLREISIPNTVTMIGEGAFFHCGKLTKVIFKDGESVLSLNMDVFEGCPIEDLYIGRTLDYLSNSSSHKPFKQVAHITIGDSVTSIYDGVSLYDVHGSNLEQLNRLSNELYESYKYALDVPGLKTVVLGKSLTKAPAFEAAKLERITCRSTTPPDVIGKLSYYVILNSPLYVPQGAKEAYKRVAPWKDFVIKEQP